MVFFVFEQCTINDETVEAAVFHEPPNITVTVTKLVFPHHMSKQDFGRTHLDIQIRIMITILPLERFS